MKLIEYKNMNVMLLEWNDLDAAFAVREKLFATLWPLNHGQQRKVMEEFCPFNFEKRLTWTVGTIIEVDRVMNDAVDIRAVGGMLYSAWKYDVLMKTMPI